ncbi:hypothetical protein J416_08412 [Gracilibacillus halophilus YIM-C55.5]|uniref:Uncharacterized protein n=1 Tax=Gracilibacillus halophilus YIM-C55.5 TaxID=1308866 RepID=N4WCF2_9BACI|nr:hypothetical protein [Gracilibacillus halophilus]ENH96919.1 hypothetical protein J416_08412 [Gracilibacillus halophilus YIM-C55.5]
MKKWIFILPFIIIIIVILFFSGYRFTAFSAAKSHDFLPVDADVVEQHDIGSSVIYLFKSDEEEMYHTVLSEKKCFFYHSDVSTYTPFRSGDIQTIGGIRYTTKDEEATMMSVISNDKEVAYIEAGAEPYTKKKKIKIGEPITFLFSYSKPINQLNAVATNKEGEELYYYGYPENATHININEDLRWYKIDEQ